MIVWHYTTGRCLSAILDAGEIRPATLGVPAHERPIVWFSTNQQFEMTARKGIIRHGQRLTATIREMHDLDGGLFRLGVDPARLLSFAELKQAAHMDAQTIAGLRRAARAVGADPRQWMGTFDPIPVTECVIEKGSPQLIWTAAATTPPQHR